MAAGDPAQSQPPATGCSVPLDRLDRVCGASGIIAARSRKQGRDSDLVSTNEKDQKLSQSGTRRQSPRDPGNLLLEFVEGSRVRCRERADHEIDSANLRMCENHGPNQLAQSALQFVSLRRCFAVFRNDQPRSGKAQRGGRGADIEMLRPPSPPRLSHALKLGPGSNPLPSRITGPFTLQRTSRAV